MNARFTIIGFLALSMLLMAAVVCFGLMLLASQGLLHPKGACLLVGFATTLGGIGGTLHEKANKHAFFPNKSVGPFFVWGGCASMLLGMVIVT